MKTKDIEKIEIELLLEGILRRWGYDFRQYAKASLKRRLLLRLAGTNLTQISDMVPLVLNDPVFFNDLLADLSITVTDFFRNPNFYRAVRDKVIPLLKTYPFVKIWHAGCSTAEEVYSMAILLHEENFLERAQIYATDFNSRSLDTAQQGIYPLEKFKQYTQNYNLSGGKGSFSDYFTTRYQSGIVRSFLKEKITFANHNLVTDTVFGEMNLILCRNVLIYFDQTLKDRVLSLFNHSLCHRGILCLGSKETIYHTAIENHFETIDSKTKIYRRKTFSSASAGGFLSP